MFKYWIFHLAHLSFLSIVLLSAFFHKENLCGLMLESLFSCDKMVHGIVLKNDYFSGSI